MENDLDSLTPDQKDKVTNFMAITAIENSNTAIQFLQMCNFDLQVISKNNFPNEPSFWPQISTPLTQPSKPEAI